MGNVSSVKAQISKKCKDDNDAWPSGQRKATISKLVKLYDKILAETGNHEKTLEVIQAEYCKMKKAALQNQSLLALLDPKVITADDAGKAIIDNIISSKKTDTAGAAAALGAVEVQSESFTAAAAVAAPSKGEAKFSANPELKTKQKASKSALQECPICMDMCPDVQRLQHANDSTMSPSLKAATAGHKACAACRKQMVSRNQKCPWCRQDVVWRSVFGFLDNLKKDIGKAHTPDELADLMTHWQEYEMMRSTADVLIFAGHMVHDVTLCKHLDRVINDGVKDFLRDSAGLWCRFNALIQDGELVVDDETFSKRMKSAIGIALSNFDLDGGHSPHHGGAMYAQIAVAVLCASMKGMSTKTMISDCRRVGHAFLKYWSTNPKHIQEVKPHLPCMYVEGVSSLVWGSFADDPILRTFYAARYQKLTDKS